MAKKLLEKLAKKKRCTYNLLKRITTIVTETFEVNFLIKKENMQEGRGSVMVMWSSLLVNFIQISFNSGSTLLQILLLEIRNVQVRISDNGPSWK